MIDVLIVDDQNLTHKLIETYLKPESELNIVGFANNGREAMEKTASLQPDVILMDVEMPIMNGLTATKFITQKHPQSKVLMLTVHDNEEHLRQALKNGAKGYLLKTIKAQELKNAICYVNQGYFQLSAELTEKYLQKIVISSSEVEEISEIDRKVNYLYKSLTKLNRQLKKGNSENLGEELEQKIDDLIQQQMALLRDRDSHLQFKVDCMNHNQERLGKNFSYLFRVQIGCIIAILLSISYQIFTSLN